MTRIVLVWIVFFVFSSVTGQGLEIGVYAEPQLAWINSDEGNISANGSIFNLNTGIEFDIYFMPNYALSLGLNLNNQGGKLLYGDPIQFQQTSTTLSIPANTELKHNLQYVGIPLGLKLKTEELGYTTIYFHGGFSPLINLKAITSDGASLDGENIKPEVNMFNLNYFIEAGIEYKLAGNTALIFGFKWSAGFLDVTKNDFANNNLSSAGLHLGLLF